MLLECHLCTGHPGLRTPAAVDGREGIKMLREPFLSELKHKKELTNPEAILNSPHSSEVLMFP